MGSGMGFDFGNTRIFADGADRDAILSLRDNALISGFTTNPTLMRAAGVDDYESFALDLVQLVPDRPLSFEVFSDDMDEMYEQALKISSWGPHVHVKIPITNTSGVTTADLQRRLANESVQLNVTALLTLDQVEIAASALARRPARVRVGLRGAHRRYGNRSGPGHGQSRGDARSVPATSISSGPVRARSSTSCRRSRSVAR